MIGENEPWQPLWISVYNVKCLTLRDYRHGRVFFAGDSAHLIPVFGVRGIDFGLDDAGNLAWKLARVLDGDAPDELLDSYSIERVRATQECISYGVKRTEFMAPPNFAFRLMREAALRLAVIDTRVRTLINPRQSGPIVYRDSPLSVPQQGEWSSEQAAPGMPAPEALLRAAHGRFHLTQCFGKDFVCLVFGDGPLPHVMSELAEHGIGVLDIPPDADELGQARLRYGLTGGHGRGLVLVRPDGYVMGRWRGLDPAAPLTSLESKGMVS
jgi:3-(3-hydroxy-phenyl)propionate hydroxylase